MDLTLIELSHCCIPVSDKVKPSKQLSVSPSLTTYRRGLPSLKVFASILTRCSTFMALYHPNLIYLSSVLAFCCCVMVNKQLSLTDNSILTEWSIVMSLYETKLGLNKLLFSSFWSMVFLVFAFIPKIQKLLPYFCYSNFPSVFFFHLSFILSLLSSFLQTFFLFICSFLSFIPFFLFTSFLFFSMFFFYCFLLSFPFFFRFVP